MRTLSTSAPSNSFQTVLTVVPPSQSRRRTGVASRGRSSPPSRPRRPPGEPRAGGRGQVGHGGGVVAQPLEVVHRELAGAERLLAERGDRVGPLGGREGGEGGRGARAPGGRG